MPPMRMVLISELLQKVRHYWLGKMRVTLLGVTIYSHIFMPSLLSLDGLN